uniref:Ig-like domain-containing protein n=1 Tax=Kryptolebias marmoratus TaxID=37003 RepID=A0A3Q3BK58_KRYMA
MTRTEVYHVSSSKTTVEKVVIETVKESTTVVEKPKEKPSVPATIVTKPKSLTVEEGHNARFECDADGDPAPSITWLHEGEAVGPSARHHIVSTQYNSTFEISAVEMSDEGSYTLLVENSGGKQEAHFSLTIKNCKGSVFINKVNIYCVLGSRTASGIRWILNGVEVSNSEQYRYGVSGNDQTLTIRCVSQCEQGIITCQAQTEQGPVWCQFHTKVTAKHSGAPHFLVQPRSQNVDEGQNVKFTCEITGEPSPEVEWLKDNIVVSILRTGSPGAEEDRVPRTLGGPGPRELKRTGSPGAEEDRVPRT